MAPTLSDEEERMIAQTEETVARVGLPGVTVVRGPSHSLVNSAPGVVESIQARIVEPTSVGADGKVTTFKVQVSKGADYMDPPAPRPGVIVAASTVASDHPAFVQRTDSEADIAARQMPPILLGAVATPGAVSPALPEDADKDWVTLGDVAARAEPVLASGHPDAGGTEVAAKAEPVKAPTVKAPPAKPRASK